MAMEDIVDFVVHRNAAVLDLWHFLAEGLVRHQGEKFLAAKHNQVVDCNSVLCSHTHMINDFDGLLLSLAQDDCSV